MHTMNAFVIVASTLLVLTLDLWLARVNRYFLAVSRHAQGVEQPTPSLWATANTAARWLGLVGGGLAAPLLVLLAINPNGSGWDWVVYMGLLGTVLIAAGAVLSVAVFVARCISHPDEPLHLARFLYQKTRHAIQNRLIPTLRQHGKAILIGAVAVGVGIVLMPLILEIIKLLGYLAFLALAGRLGMLSADDDYMDERYKLVGYYNYMTGKWDNGLSIGGLYDDDDD